MHDWKWLQPRHNCSSMPDNAWETSPGIGPRTALSVGAPLVKLSGHRQPLCAENDLLNPSDWNPMGIQVMDWSVAFGPRRLLALAELDQVNSTTASSPTGHGSTCSRYSSGKARKVQKSDCFKCSDVSPGALRVHLLYCTQQHCEWLARHTHSLTPLASYGFSKAGVSVSASLSLQHRAKSQDF